LLDALGALVDAGESLGAVGGGGFDLLQSLPRLRGAEDGCHQGERGDELADAHF